MSHGNHAVAQPKPNTHTNMEQKKKKKVHIDTQTMKALSHLHRYIDLNRVALINAGAHQPLQRLAESLAAKIKTTKISL